MKLLESAKGAARTAKRVENRPATHSVLRASLKSGKDPVSMMSFSLGRLPVPVLCLTVMLVGLGVGQAAAQNPQQQPSQQQQQQPKPPNPFETVPQGPAEPPKPPPVQPAQPAQPPAAQRPAVVTRPGQPPENIVEGIEFRGARRVRQDTLQALIFTKKGDRFDEETLHRDFISLWNSGRFDDLRIEREPGKQGWIIRFVVVERPVVRTIKYEGNKSVSVSDILDRYHP
jgi:outer membrane protein insertion porin family